MGAAQKLRARHPIAVMECVNSLTLNGEHSLFADHYLLAILIAQLTTDLINSTGNVYEGLKWIQYQL